ncbi:MAG: FHA domain-containing protein [Chloroflexi bacterium]|nr:FHA domain-containing protein [Chloroflexota bacterium]
MPHGGGFCELHGPFDPPHVECPFCAQDRAQRQAYGPPAGIAPPRIPAAQPPASETFERQTVNADDLPVEVDVADFELEDELPDLAHANHDITELLPGQKPVAVAAMPIDPDEPVGYLVIKAPVQRRGRVLVIRANQVIGRDGDVQYDDPRMSRQHARLTLEPVDYEPAGKEWAKVEPAENDDAAEAEEHDPAADTVFHIWPFGPTNPVLVNGVAIRGATSLAENDEIQLGETLFVFKVLAD